MLPRKAGVSPNAYVLFTFKFRNPQPFLGFAPMALKRLGKAALFFCLSFSAPISDISPISRCLPPPIFRLAAAKYPASTWAKGPLPPIPPAEFGESWQLQSGLSSWAWRTLGELKDNGTPAPRFAFNPLTSPLKPAFSFSLSQHQSYSVQTRSLACELL